MEEFELELGRGGFGFDILEKNASVKADMQATGVTDEELVTEVTNVKAGELGNVGEENDE